MKKIRKISYCQALNEAMRQEMERDPNIFVYGLGVPDHKRVFTTTAGLVEKFGKERCFDTPLSEDTMTGFGLGAAISGMRPIHIHMRVDFLLLAVNQLANMVSNYRYATAGKLRVPLLIRAVVGRGRGQSFQHSKTMHSIFAHIPGLKVVLPTTPRDAKGLLIAAIRDENPVIFIEHRWLYFAVDEVPELPYTIPLEEANILRSGRDVTVVATSWMNVEALKAAQVLERKHKISVEVIDARIVAPFNDKLIVHSVNKTGHCIVADNDWLDCGFSAEVAARVSEKCFSQLKSPVQRIGFAPTPCPCTKSLENCFYPNAIDIIKTIESKLNLEEADLSNEDFYGFENKFNGPF
ncbi:MAG: alpha-ketoacid dehydrogenase subunit beta [Candidatus Omnitrophota bacterium]|nr:MAG: alpha-ketoacid dehydrogenase subunit beta [Candidatus Omnitrophota bacterium]